MSGLAEILVFLAAFNCHPNVDIEQVDSLSHPGAYISAEHKVLIRNGDDGVLVHELGHACGFDHPKIHKIELAWRNRDA